MPKHFRYKKKRFHLIPYLAIIYLTYQFTVSFLTNIKLNVDNQEFIKRLINDDNYFTIYEKSSNNLVNSLMRFLYQVDIKKPVTILEKSFSYKIESESSSDDYSNLPDLEKITSYIKDPNPTNVSTPKVYIYNSHQLENYSTKHLEIYNITPNVMMASYLLKEKLNKLSIPTIVEESNITEFMKMNNWVHSDSYKASRFYILDTLNNNKSLDLIIDIHRDAVKKDASTVAIKDKAYAKILFVVGKENPNYKVNLDLANKINNLLKEKYPNISRGVITKAGSRVDGVYNQDISPKMVLIEVGAVENTIDEVMNTMDALSNTINDYLGG